jgi:hypothetical protein
MGYLNSNTSLTGRQWDRSMQTPFFNYKVKVRFARGTARM